MDMYKVIRKFVRRDKVPCEGFYMYSITNGRSWMTSKEYKEFRERVLEEQF